MAEKVPTAAEAKAALEEARAITVKQLAEVEEAAASSSTSEELFEPKVEPETEKPPFPQFPDEDFPTETQVDVVLNRARKFAPSEELQVTM